MEKNLSALEAIRTMLKHQLRFLCINDLMNHENVIEAEEAKKALKSFYLELYPKKSSFEL